MSDASSNGEATMNRLTTNDVAKLEIIRLPSLLDGTLSVSALSKQLGYKYDTIRTALTFLLICDICYLNTVQRGDRCSEYIGLTELGRQVSKQIELAS
jgi:hypothetical protein